MKTVNLTNVKKGLVLKKMQVNQGFEMAVGEEWDWRGERHSTVGSGDTREEEEEEEKAEGSEVGLNISF